MRNQFYLAVCILLFLSTKQSVAQNYVPYRKGSLYGLADTNGKIVLKPIYSSLWYAECTSSKYFIGKYNKGSDFVSVLIKDGKVLFEAAPNHILSFSDDQLILDKYIDTSKISYRYIIRDLGGKQIIPSELANFEVLARTNNDLSVVDGYRRYLINNDTLKSTLFVRGEETKGLSKLYMISPQQALTKIFDIPCEKINYINNYNPFYAAELSGDTNFVAYKMIMQKNILDSLSWYDGLNYLVINTNQKNEKPKAYILVKKDATYELLNHKQFAQYLLDYYKQMPKPVAVDEEETENDGNSLEKPKHYRYVRTTIKGETTYSDDYTTSDDDPRIKLTLPSGTEIYKLVNLSTQKTEGDTVFVIQDLLITKKADKYGLLGPLGINIAADYDSILIYYNYHGIENIVVGLGKREPSGRMLFGIYSLSKQQLITSFIYDSIISDEYTVERTKGEKGRLKIMHRSAANGYVARYNESLELIKDNKRNIFWATDTCGYFDTQFYDTATHISDYTKAAMNYAWLSSCIVNQGFILKQDSRFGLHITCYNPQWHIVHLPCSLTEMPLGFIQPALYENQYLIALYNAQHDAQPDIIGLTGRKFFED